MNEKKLAMTILVGPTYQALAERADLQRVFALLKSGITAEDLALLQHVAEVSASEKLDPIGVASFLKKLAEV